MRIKYFLAGFFLIIVAPYVFSYAEALGKTGPSTWGWLIEFFGAICAWIGTPMMIYGQVFASRGTETSISRKWGIVTSIAILSVGYFALKWNSAIEHWFKEAFDICITESFMTFWGVIGIGTGSVSLIIDAIIWVHANMTSIRLFLMNLQPMRWAYAKLRKVASKTILYSERHGYQLSEYALGYLALHVFIVLLVVTPSSFGWFRWISIALSLTLFWRLGRSTDHPVLLEQIGRNITPVLALSGFLYGYFLSDPLGSAISNSFGVFFLFFTFNLPKLILHRDIFFERLLFSSICGIVAFGGNIFMGSTLSILESIRDGASYSVIRSGIEGALGTAILAILCFLAAELFCDAHLLSIRGVDSYSYEKAAGSLFFLSFFFGFGGNKIVSPILFLLSILILVKNREPMTKIFKKVLPGVSALKQKMINRFTDTSIDRRLVSEAVLGSSALVMLNFRFFGHAQVELIHLFVILLQLVPILLFLYPREHFAVFYIISSISIIVTGIAGIVYMRSWPFCAFMAELSDSLSDLFGTTGLGEVPPNTFLSWLPFFYLSITLSAFFGIPLDAIRRDMEKLYNRRLLEDLRKIYYIALVIMIVAFVFFALCLYPLLLEYRPTFALEKGGELIHYDLFWVFFVLYSVAFAVKLRFSQYELYRPIALLEVSRLSEH